MPIMAVVWSSLQVSWHHWHSFSISTTRGQLHATIQNSEHARYRVLLFFIWWIWPLPYCDSELTSETMNPFRHFGRTS